MDNALPNSHPITPTAALHYVQAWGKERSFPTDRLEKMPDGSFQGRLRGVDFQYIAAGPMLIIRAVVEPSAEYGQILPVMISLLQNYAASDPGSVDEATFELIRVPWQNPTNQERGLYLRKEIRTAMISDGQFVKDVDRLSRTAYHWSHTRITDVIREARKKSGLPD